MTSSSRSRVDPFLAMDVLDRANALARSGRTVFHLEAGQPGTRAPKRALEAAQKALADDKLGYTEAVGRPALRERISRFYRDTYAVDVAPERIIITTGSSAGFLLAFIALFESGQSLAMAVPGYPAYRNIALALGLRPHFIACREAEHFRLTAKAIAATPDIDGVLIASPGNPSGTVIPADELAAIADTCDTRGLKLISDEIYHGITYGERAQTALAFSRNAIVINSFSKYFSMTGWRIGWMVVPDDLVRTIERLTQNFYISPPTISQVAALAALDATDEADAYVRTYAANRARLLAALKDAGFDAVAPADGAFYLYANVSPFNIDAATLAQRLLEETGVAATPGHDFDPFDGDRWIRFSYAGAQNEVDNAATALVAWCRALPKT
ncbi:MAG: aminotransferase class I/II-fold pyridoxal phosphate-dependent enzyme [Alphaproteobacteria bacterium]|nr:aminotransferase class I/II-fold pyridoxal phosphate-dependent enzyme [Alphaproteobacteria bacterium]